MKTQVISGLVCVENNNGMFYILSKKSRTLWIWNLPALKASLSFIWTWGQNLLKTHLFSLVFT